MSNTSGSEATIRTVPFLRTETEKPGAAFSLHPAVLFDKTKWLLPFPVRPVPSRFEAVSQTLNRTERQVPLPKTLFP